MNKIILFTVFVLCSQQVAYSQQVATVKGDKINTATLKTEPWRVSGTSNMATSNTQSIYQNGNVGVGDFSNSSIAERLQIKGETKVNRAFVTAMDNVDNANASNFVPLGVNVANGELTKITNQNNVKPFSYVTFVVKTAPNEDWVKQFDTKIPKDQYTVVLINAMFFDGKLALRDYGSSKGYAPFNYVAETVRYDDNGTTKNVPSDTWVLSADYINTAPQPGNFYWKFICLVIQNQQIKELPQQNITLDAENNGAAADKPVGL